MAKIVMIVPTEEMLAEAKELAARVNVDMEVYHENSQTVLARVAGAQTQGALVAVARGNHANLILTNMDIPLVEIRMSGQVIAQLVTEARAMCAKPLPTVAFVGFVNMFTDTHVFEPILGVTIRNYFVDSSAQLAGAVHKAYQEGADVIIGGEIAGESAKMIGMPFLFLQSGMEDLEAALRSANRVLYAIEIEKKNTAEMSTLLNYSFDGIFRINQDGVITVVNYMAERIFHRHASEIIGQSVSSMFDAQDSDAIMRVLHEGQKKYAVMLHKGNISLVANIAAISVDDTSEGAILSFQEFQTIEQLEEGIRRDRTAKGFTALGRFENCSFESTTMKQAMRLAEQYAKFDLPVLIQGELGTGKRMLAECIHNASMRRKNPFVAFDCASIPPEMQQSMLTGQNDKSTFQLAHTGTLFIEHIEKMEPYCQYQLLCGLRDGVIWQHNHTLTLPVNMRVIASTSDELYALVQKGSFSEPLYCLLSQLELQLPPLRTRREDIPGLLDRYMDQYCAQYRKYIVLTNDAREYLCALLWPGNTLQLRLFMEKLVLLSENRVVDAEAVRHYQTSSFLTPQEPQIKAQEEPRIVYGEREASEILRLLDEHGGNRTQVAQSLGVSKSTLWRKMKKLGIENTFKM